MRETFSPVRPSRTTSILVQIRYHIFLGAADDKRANLFMRYMRVYRLIGDRWKPISHRTVYATDRG